MRQLAALVALCLAVATGAAAEPVKIRIGWINTPGQLTPILFAKPGIARHLGISYDWEPVHFNSSPPQITALAAGDIEIASLGFSTISFAVLNARLDDIRIIADENRDGAFDHFSISFLVRKDSGIDKVEDLKGKVLATIGIGSGVDIAMTTMLTHHGLKPKADYTPVEVAFPNMAAVLLERKADLITVTNPWIRDPRLESDARILFTTRDAMGVSELSFWTARRGFLEKNRAAMVDLMEDYVRLVRWYVDPANHQEAVDIVARFTKLPADRFDAWVFTDRDSYRAPDGAVDVAVLQRNIEAQRELGLIKAGFDAADYADLSIVRDGAARVDQRR